jgi:hypothetical protein
MDKQEALELFNHIHEEYRSIKQPIYRNADLEDLQNKLQSLYSIREHFERDCVYQRLINSISQVIIRINSTGSSDWGNPSECGINKAIKPVINKANQDIVFPFSWIDAGSKRECSIDKGFWGPDNYMVMDVIGYMYLLKEGGDTLPEKAPPLFDDLESIKTRENELHPDIADTPPCEDKTSVLHPVPESISSSKFRIRFSDEDFRRFTGKTKMSSEQIRNLLLETSRVEFKLVFPVRMMDDNNKLKERLYRMNIYSRFYEFGYVDTQVRKDGIIQCREYVIAFNTILGELFINNLVTHNFGYLNSNFYKLPPTAQLLYRRLLLHNNLGFMELNLSTIRERLNLTDSNITNLTRTIEENGFEPLQEQGFIKFYSKEKGLTETKYSVQR